MSDTENLNEARDSGLLQPRLVRLAVFALRSGLFFTLLVLIPLWLPVWLVITNIGDYWNDELSRWLPAWWANAKKAWRGESLPNAKVEAPPHKTPNQEQG
jgi:hypothetical protein